MFFPVSLSPRLWVVAGVAGVVLGVLPAGAQVIREDFGQQVVGERPVGPILTLASDGSGDVRVVDSNSVPREPFGPDGNRSLFLRSTGTTTVTYSGDSGLQQGSLAFSFWPLSDQTYEAPRVLVRLTGGSATSDWGPYLQFSSEVVHVYSGAGTIRLAQKVRLNAANHVALEFDVATQSFTGTLNGEPLTASSDGGGTFTFFGSPESLRSLAIQVGPKTKPSAVFFDDLVLSWIDSNDGIGWSGQGAYRVLVRVEPVAIGERERDELPADLELDFVALLDSLGLEGKANLASLQVMKYDRETAAKLPSQNYAYAKSPFDRAFRWYDSLIPYDFPEFYGSISSTLVPQRKNRVRAGYFYNVVGDWEKGRLAWTHAQERNEPSYYAIYFDAMERDAEVNEVPPRGWIGDGMPRFDRIGSSSTGADHTRIAVTDWTGNGLPDIIYGESYGKLILMPNRGSATAPHFPVHRMLFDADDLPIDLGLSSAPVVVDWTGNGVEDVIVGTHWNRMVFFRNVGTNANRVLQFEGFVELDGQPLELPWEPVVGRPAGAFIRDYYPVIEAVDWNGNGELDLLAGGYVTGLIFLYENTGRGENGLPVLVDRGPLRDAGGQIINVGDWCAAPTVADFTGNGLPDLITGNLPMTADSWNDEYFLRFYANIGSPAEPLLERREFPAVGAFPRVGLTSPRAVDWNGDGLLDLIVSSRRDIYLLENVGTATAPLFKLTEKIESRWGDAPLSVTQFLDWNQDGLPDVVSNYSVSLNSGQGNPYFFPQRVNVLPPGVQIAHPSGIGDDWFYPRLYDFNQNGKVDVLFGDWWGQVRFHRNLSTEEEVVYDVEGEILRMVNGEPIKVGPLGEPDDSFVSLQGARTTFSAADFNGNGIQDLVIGDTFGIVRFYQNIGGRDDPVFALPVEIGNLGIRTEVEATDWDNDGRIDVIAGAANGNVRVFLNTGREGSLRFAAGFDPQLPPVLQPRVKMVDLNSDGDEDLFIPSTQGSVWVERSFLQHGYAPAQFLAVQSRESVLGTMNYQMWSSENFSEAQRNDPGYAGKLADPLGEGIVNLVRYGFGLSPGGLQRERLPLVVVGESGLRIEFFHRRNATDVDYVVEASSDLVIWEEIPWRDLGEREVAEEFERVRLPLSLHVGRDRLFTRVRIVDKEASQ
jgi:hypothetical protein